MNIYKKRIESVKNILIKNNLDGIYVSNLTNIRYLTGFTGSAALLLIVNDECYFLTDGRYTEQSKTQVKNCKIFIVSNSYLEIIKKSDLIPKKSKIGFETLHITYNSFLHLSNVLSHVDFFPLENIIEEIAAIKDKFEIENLKHAIEITDKVFDDIIPELKVGAVEKQIAAKISYLFKMYGADGDSYDPIIASGRLGALPHAQPSDKSFEDGDFVVMDFGALYNGYHADMTRTVLIGSSTDQHKEIYEVVLSSQMAGIAAAKAGITGQKLDQVCRDVISNAGYGKRFIHSTGHGIGLEVHTLPRISAFNTKPLLKNNVITIEPGIYIEGWGGVRIEDDCLINESSCTPLNRSTKDLLILN